MPGLTVPATALQVVEADALPVLVSLVGSAQHEVHPRGS